MMMTMLRSGTPAKYKQWKDREWYTLKAKTSHDKTARERGRGRGGEGERGEGCYNKMYHASIPTLDKQILYIIYIRYNSIKDTSYNSWRNEIHVQPRPPTATPSSGSLQQSPVACNNMCSLLLTWLLIINASAKKQNVDVKPRPPTWYYLLTSIRCVDCLHDRDSCCLFALFSQRFSPFSSAFPVTLASPISWTFCFFSGSLLVKLRILTQKTMVCLTVHLFLYKCYGFVFVRFLF